MDWSWEEWKMDVIDILSNDECYLDLISLPMFEKHCDDSFHFFG